MSLPTQITTDNFINEFANLLTGDIGELNTVYKIVFRCGNDASSYNEPPHLNPLRSQCSTTTNLINFLFTDGKYIPQISGYITKREDLIKFNDTLDMLTSTNMVNITFDVNGAFEDNGKPYFPGHIFNILINKNTNSYKLLQSFLYNYTARDYTHSETSIREVFSKYYEIFVLPLGMKFVSSDSGYDLMKNWKDITDTDNFGYPNRPNILGECRPKFMYYSIKYQTEDEYFKTYMNNIVRLLNLFYQKILYMDQNIDNISKALGTAIPTVQGQADFLNSLLRSKYSNYINKCIFSKGIHKYYLLKGVIFFDSLNILILRENNDIDNEKTIINYFTGKNHPILEINYKDIGDSDNDRKNYLTYLIDNMTLGKAFLTKKETNKEHMFIRRLDTGIYFLELICTIDGTSINKVIQQQKTRDQIIDYVNNPQNIFYF